MTPKELIRKFRHANKLAGVAKRARDEGQFILRCVELKQLAVLAKGLGFKIGVGQDGRTVHDYSG